LLCNLSAQFISGGFQLSNVLQQRII